MPKPCPCTSGRAFADCCGPYLRGEREAPTPEALMRSRFAAFALGDVSYLWRTLHAEHEDRAQPKEDLLRDLREASRRYKYMGLTILEAKDTRVLFVARIFEKGRDRSFVELSRFEHDGTGWRYRAGSGASASELPPPQELTIDGFMR